MGIGNPFDALAGVGSLHPSPRMAEGLSQQQQQQQQQQQHQQQQQGYSPASFGGSQFVPPAAGSFPSAGVGRSATGAPMPAAMGGGGGGADYYPPSGAGGIGGFGEAAAAVAAAAAAASNASPADLGPAGEFGMKGLLKVLAPGASGLTDTLSLTGSSLTGTSANAALLLTHGVDLTQLGLDLNSHESLNSSWLSPWDAGAGVGAAGAAAGGGSGGGGGGSGGGAVLPVTGGKYVGGKNGEPSYELPSCYFTQPPRLKGAHFTKFQLETLFYIFYMLPQDALQLLAARELCDRDWNYHTDMKLWFTRAPGSSMSVYPERAAYIYFDINSWERRPYHDATRAFVAGFLPADDVRTIADRL